MGKIIIRKKGNKRFQDGQNYSECQLVSALNAAYFLGENFINPHSDEYERLVDLVGARCGSAINIDRAYQYLRLKYVDVKPVWESIFYAMNMGQPISITINTKRYGLHGVTIIEIKHNNKMGGYDVRVPNIAYYTNRSMWISWNEFEKSIYELKNIRPQLGYFRIFYIDPLCTKK